MIHVVHGHICSGKSTWVQEHAGPDDVIVDMDDLAAAMSSDHVERYAYGTHVLHIVRLVRWHAIDEAVRLHRRGGFDVWIVHAYPTESDVARYRRTGARFKRTDCDHDTLRARARAERPPAMVDELERRLRIENEQHAF